MDKNIEKMTKWIRRFGLNDKEKLTMKARVFSYVDENPPVVPSPYNFFSLPMLTAYTLSFLLLFTGTISTLAQNTVPGDMLYNVKTNFNEPIAIVLSFTHESKARIYGEIAQNRLIEAEKLVVRDKDNQETLNDLSEDFQESSKKANDHLNIVKSSGDTDTAVDISTDLQTGLQAHEETLTSLSDQTNDNESALKTILEGVSLQEDTAETTNDALENVVISSEPQEVSDSAADLITDIARQIDELGIKIKDLTDDGIDMNEEQNNLEESQKLFDQGKGAHDHGDLSQSILLLNQSKELISKTLALIDISKKIGADVTTNVNEGENTEIPTSTDTTE